MSRYISMVKYAAGAYAGTAAEGPSARAEVLHNYAKSIGAEIEGMWYTTGEWDMIMVTKGELDAKTLAGFWNTLGTGAFDAIVSYPAFDPDEFQAGFDEVDLGSYRPPSAE